MSVYLNDRLITDLVRDVIAIDGYLAPAVATRTVQPIANAPSLFGTSVTVSPRAMSVVLDVRGASLPDRTALMDSLRHRLTGLLLVRTIDAPTREQYATCTGVEVTYYATAFAHPGASVTVRLVAVDPTRYEREARAVSLSTSRAAVAVGTMPSAPVVYLYGASPSVVDPVVIVRNASGDETHRLTLTGTLATNDALVIDAARQTIARYVAGVLQTGTSSGNAWLTSGRFPLLSPEDAINGAGLTVELSSTSGTATGVLLYTRGY